VDAFDPNSSAAEADLRHGDILSKVDGVDVHLPQQLSCCITGSDVSDAPGTQVFGMQVPQVAEMIFGPVGTPVTLTLLRGGLTGQVVIVELERRESAAANG